MEKKNFYVAIVDGYDYYEITTNRYKNFVDFMIAQWGDELEKELKKYITDGDTGVDWVEFFDEYYGYTTYYVAIDEDQNELEDLEDNNATLNNYCNEHNLFKNDKVED